jgi:hypothetical protein
MTEAEWLDCTEPGRMLSLLLEAGERKLRLLTCACLRRLWPLLPGGPCRQAVEVGEAWADDLASREGLRGAFESAVKFPGEAGEESSVQTIFGMGEGNFGRTIEEVAAGAADVFPDYGAALHAAGELAVRQGRGDEERATLARLLRCVFGPLSLAQVAYDQRLLPSGMLEPARLALLADALEEAGCTNADLLGHLRGPGPHVRGCWALDLLLGKT